MSRPDVPGRGTAANPPNRYEPLHVKLEPDPDSDAPPAPTVFYRDTSRTILAENDSPDVGFRFSLNPYRGCEHGCVYCLEPETPILHGDIACRRRPLRLRRVPGARTDPEIPARGGRGGVVVEPPDAAPRHRADGGRRHGGASMVAGAQFSLVAYAAARRGSPAPLRARRRRGVR